MKLIVLPALVIATSLSSVHLANATESLDEQIAALKKENATLKKVMRLQSLQKENAELRSHWIGRPLQKLEQR
jgi:cell division protein FtsB